MDIVTYALLNKKIKGLASGVKSATVQGTSIVFTMNDGSKQTITFPTPADGVSITDVDVNSDKHLIVRLSDNRTIDAGLVPTVKGDTGSKGKDGINGKDGADGVDGIDGVSPTVTITEATGRHTVSITDKDGVHSFVVKDGSALDVNNYYTKDEANSLLNGKADKADIPTVPTNLSELTNDENFIKNTVDNLTNYYKKNETYTQEEINELVSNLNKLTTQIVENLPTENIDTSTIYLVKQGETNNYMQYMYIKSAWAELGSTEVNLSSYVTLTKMNEELDKKADKSEIPTVPTKVSAFTNDVGYLTEYTETDPTVPAWAKSPTKPSYSAEEIGALPDDTEIPIFTNKEVLDKISAEKVANWNDAVAKTHEHNNKSVIDKFSESAEGDVLYNGEQISSGNIWVGTKSEYNAIIDKDAETLYAVTDESSSLSDWIIDDAVTSDDKTWSSDKISASLHTHENKTVLDKFTEGADGGVLYNGSAIGGSNITVDDTLSTTSENPVQNKVITTAIDKKADKAVAKTVTLTASWSSNTKTVTVEGITVNSILIVTPAPNSQEAYSKAGIVCSAQAEGSLTFTCKTAPTASIDINILIM